MTEFEDALERFLQAAARDMNAPFVLRRDARVAGRWVALEAAFSVQGERKIFGIVPTGSATHCHETCLFVPAEALGAETLEPLLRYVEQVHDSVVKPDALHEFSLVSLVIVTQACDAAAARRLKKYAYEKKYTAPQSGWSSTRVAAVELPRKKIYCNPAGSALRDRLLSAVKSR